MAFIKWGRLRLDPVHWVAVMKKNWRSRNYYFYLLIGNTESASNFITLYEGSVGSKVVLTPLQEFLYVGKYEKSNVPVGFCMLIAATAHQSASTIFPSLKEFLAEDHNFTKYNVGPSVTLIMNINGTVYASLFSGGVEVSGDASSHLHNAMFNPYHGLKHAADFLNIMKYEARIHFTDYDQYSIQPTPNLLHM